jgi:hypothetical protein
MQQPEKTDMEHYWELEINYWLNGGTNFRSMLFSLIQKADRVNREKIRQAFPTEVSEYEKWLNSGSESKNKWINEAL